MMNWLRSGMEKPTQRVTSHGLVTKNQRKEVYKYGNKNRNQT